MAKRKRRSHLSSRKIRHMQRNIERQQAQRVEPIPFRQGTREYRIAESRVIHAAMNDKPAPTWTREAVADIREEARKVTKR
jgi:hypothetical protein